MSLLLGAAEVCFQDFFLERFIELVLYASRHRLNVLSHAGTD
jgi:hypothetical protein